MNPKKEKITFWQAAFERDVVFRALRVSAVVGTLLFAINHGDVFVGGGMVVWWKVILTYFVPYGVSTYSSAAQRIEGN